MLLKRNTHSCETAWATKIDWPREYDTEAERC